MSGTTEGWPAHVIPSRDAAVAPGSLPLLGHALQLWRRPIAFLESLRTHGDIVRVDVATWPVHVLTSPDLIHSVLVGDSKNFGRGRVFHRLRPLFGNGLPLTDGEFHRKQRRLLQPAFQRNHITAYAEMMCRQADEMSTSWNAGQEIQVATEMRRFALSSVAAMIFSGDLAGSAVEEVHRSFPILVEGILRRAIVPKALDRLPITMNRRFDAAAARMRRIIDDVIVRYGTEASGRDDFLSLLLSTVDAETGETMSDEQVRDEVISIFFAATETSATVLSWIFHELACHPEVEKRLHAEVDEVIGTRPVRPSDVAGLTYANNVFHEALRLHSPLLFTRRALVPVKLGGVLIPAGAELGYSPYALHRDPALFHEPRKFDPDRWNTDLADRPRPHRFIPFGAGQHKCIGDSFAASEIVIAVATVASRWRLVHAPGATVREVPGGIPQPDALAMIPLARH